jgi:hypothetical protein
MRNPPPDSAPSEKNSLSLKVSYEISFCSPDTPDMPLCVGSYATKRAAHDAANDFIQSYPTFHIILTEVTHKALISATGLTPSTAAALKEFLATAA